MKITELVEKIKSLDLIHFREIEYSENQIILNTPDTNYQVLTEAIIINEIVNKDIYDYNYDDDKHIIIITSK